MVGKPRAKLYNVVAFEWVRRVFDLVFSFLIFCFLVC